MSTPWMFLVALSLAAIVQADSSFNFIFAGLVPSNPQCEACKTCSPCPSLPPTDLGPPIKVAVMVNPHQEDIKQVQLTATYVQTRLSPLKPALDLTVQEVGADLPSQLQTLYNQVRPLSSSSSISK